MNQKEIIQWLLQGDVSIQYQTNCDLLDNDDIELKSRIEREGWGKEFLSKRNKDGHWGQKFYQPKWTSSHYTLLDIKNLSVSPNCRNARETIQKILTQLKAADGGILPIGEMKQSDMCINGMVLNYASYFQASQEDLKSVVDVILLQQMNDGGFNCRLNRSGAKHSSLHTTISVLEGVLEYQKNNYTYRKEELMKARKKSEEFVLQHRLFKSDKTGEIIDKSFLKLSYPSRWRYDILRALDYFRTAQMDYDERMKDALDVLIKKRTQDNRWKLQANHPGKFHFQMEVVGEPSRWNTLRALRVLKHFNCGQIINTDI